MKKQKIRYDILGTKAIFACEKVLICINFNLCRTAKLHKKYAHSFSYACIYHEK